MTEEFKIIDSFSDPVLITNEKGTIEYTNNATEDLFGYEKIDLIGKQIDILVPNKYHTGHQKDLQAYFKNPSPRKMGGGKWIKGRHKNGKEISIDVSLSHTLMNGQRLAIAFVTDMTKIRQLHEELDQAKQFYESMITHNLDHIFQLDKNLNILYVNHVAPGLSKGSVVGKNIIDLMPNDSSKHEVKTALTNAIKNGEVITYQNTFPSPVGIQYFSTTATPIIKNGEVYGMNLISRNVTNEVQMQAKLVEHRTFIDKLNQYSLNGVFIYDLTERKTTYSNKRYHEILGYSISEINAMSSEEYFRLFHADDIATIKQHMDNLFAAKPNEFFEIQYRFKSKSGEWVWCHSRDSGFEYSSNGKLKSYIGSFVDVSAHAKAEKSLIVKNKEMENFVYMASHDLNSPLNSVRQTLDFSISQLRKDSTEDVEKMLTLANSSVERMSELIASLLNHTKIDKQHSVEEINVVEIIQGLRVDLNAMIDESNAEIELEGLLLKITGYRILFRQLLQNLLTNALKFRRQRITPKIIIRTQDQLQHVLFEVRDNGIGIPKESLKKVFSFFYKLHSSSEFEGSGIGLTSCKKIVELHKGSIWVESEEGEGTSFFFTIQKNLQ